MYRRARNHQIPSLMECVINNLEVGISLRLTSGSNPNVYNELGESPLHLAIASEKTDIALNLLKYGAKINVRDIYGQNAFELACETLPSLMTPILLESVFLTKGEHKELLTYVEDGRYSNTILLTAEWDIECLPTLLDTFERENPSVLGSLLSAKTKLGSAIIILLKGDELDEDELPLIERLITLGCNIDAQDKKGKTALLLAAKFNKIDIVDLLLKYNASLLIRDKSGLNILDYVCARLPHLVENLIPYAAELSHEDQKDLLANISGGMYKDFMTFLAVEFPYYLYLLLPLLPNQDINTELDFLASIKFDSNLQLIKHEVEILSNEKTLFLPNLIRNLARLKINFIKEQNSFEEKKEDLIKHCNNYIEYIKSKIEEEDYKDLHQKLTNFKNVIINEKETEKPELIIPLITL